MRFGALGLLALLSGMFLLATAADAQDKARKKGKRDAASILKRLDTNNDNKLSKDEFSKLGKGDNPQRSGKLFEKLDTNNDGSLSLDELKRINEIRRKKKNGA